ncbi:MAG: hypothetical protein ACRBBN_06830 [Methyloligellaceae bacterium]
MVIKWVKGSPYRYEQEAHRADGLVATPADYLGKASTDDVLEYYARVHGIQFDQKPQIHATEKRLSLRLNRAFHGKAIIHRSFVNAVSRRKTIPEPERLALVHFLKNYPQSIFSVEALVTEILQLLVVD